MVDAASWPLWSKVDSLDTERSTGLDPGGDDGVGAVRAFRTGRRVTGERLTEKVEQRLLAYEDAFNPSMRNYHARIELAPTSDSGTVIHWYGVARQDPAQRPTRLVRLGEAGTAAAERPSARGHRLRAYRVIR
ncbi:SRPBCC family protein [Streptomyces violascens]|uniref:SRPBCC family protein n=1 Tax=Streptomyces violascens TaxID=67381 RepID=UPI0036A4D928